MKFQFTHPGKGATLTSRVARMLKRVSIHAPWEGCDRPFVGRSKRITSFNSRTLGRVRRNRLAQLPDFIKFQFTHPGKGATASLASYQVRPRSFNSRTLGRVRLLKCFDLALGGGVSIHAPWEGCDFALVRSTNSSREFQFTHPGKGATRSGQPLSCLVAWFQFTHPGKGATVWCKGAYYRADKQA